MAPHVKLPVDLGELIERVYVSPYAQGWFKGVVEAVACYWANCGPDECASANQVLPIASKLLSSNRTVMDSSNQGPAASDSQAQFPTTRWTHIVEAGGPTSSSARDALNELCRAYWSPVYAYLRRKGQDSHKAKDLAQSFFVHLLEIEFQKMADPKKGRFRSFLLSALNNFLKDDWRRQSAQKRGGDAQIVSIDENEAEERYDLLPRQEPDATRIYDRAWAGTVIEQAKRRLKESFAGRGRQEVYDTLAPFLAREPDPAKYATLASRLAMTRENVQTTLSRMNRQFGECLHKEVAQTVETQADVEDEIRYLLGAWSAKVESEEQKPNAP